MDERGFIFTTDSILALAVAIVITASVVIYAMLPAYQGQDHQHLEALADSVLSVMEQDGTLRDAAVYYANGNTTAAQNLLQTSLNSLLPSDVSYKMTLASYSPPAMDNRGLDFSIARDSVTRIRVISGPQEGWLGRSFYNIREVEFVDQNFISTNTLWNFHNYLTNFQPWRGSNQRSLDNYPYWGYNSGAAENILFSVPTGTINWSKIIFGSVDRDGGSSYGATVNINGHNYAIPSNRFNYLFSSPGDSNFRVYNNVTTVNPNDLVTGTNNYFNVNYNPVSDADTMPWFSLIANYNVTLKVPQGVSTKYYNFTDNGGMAYPDGEINNNQRRVRGYTYNFNTGTSAFGPTRNKIYTWNEYFSNHNLGLENSVPFVLRNVPMSEGTTKAGSTVSIQQDIDNTDVGQIKDAYLVINPYAAVDGAVVEVYRPASNRWEIIFNSVESEYTDRQYGYGNLPGTLDLKPYMDAGQINKVRITVWDNVPSNDYDLVGLTNCYAVVTSSKLPIWWDVFPTDSHQSNNNQIQRDIDFTIRSNSSKETYLFFAGGSDTRNVKVEYPGGAVLYNGPPPYMLNLGDLDAAGPHVITNGTTFIPGDYTVRVTVTASEAWESGDGASNPGPNANAEIFSGTRVMVLYPALLSDIWSTSYAPTAQDAINRAYDSLVLKLEAAGFPRSEIRQELITNESLYTGDLPNSIPVRLDLWTH